MKLQQALLQNTSESSDPVSNTDLARAIGLYFNLTTLFAGTFTPNTYNTLANANIVSGPIILPVNQVNVGNFTLTVDYTATKGGSGAAFTGNLNLVIAPCSVDDTIDRSQGTKWNTGIILPSSTWLSLEEDFGQALSVTGVAALNRFSQYAASVPAAFGTFCFGFWFQNLAGVQTGDTFVFNHVRLFIPGTVGGS